jgi:site-specific DNA-methyltransferase (adenine-specific)
MDIMPTLAANSVDMVLTDIPYGEVSRPIGAGFDAVRTLDKGDADVVTFALVPFVSEIVRVCSGSFYVFCGIEQVSPLAEAFKAHGLTIRVGIWEKTNPSPLNGEHLWLSATEHCVFARKSGATFNAFCAPAVWRHKNGSSDRHPTEKPVGLFRRLLEASTARGDTVLDPCAGSGTTGEAADGIGRNAILIERKPEYCALIRDRITNAAPLFGNPLEAA